MDNLYNAVGKYRYWAYYSKFKWLIRKSVRNNLKILTQIVNNTDCECQTIKQNFSHKPCDCFWLSFDGQKICVKYENDKPTPRFMTKEEVIKSKLFYDIAEGSLKWVESKKTQLQRRLKVKYKLMEIETVLGIAIAVVFFLAVFAFCFRKD